MFIFRGVPTLQIQLFQLILHMKQNVGIREEKNINPEIRHTLGFFTALISKKYILSFEFAAAVLELIIFYKELGQKNYNKINFITTTSAISKTQIP